MDKSMLEVMKAALDKAVKERNHASYLEESGANAGIRKMNANKAEWLSWVIYLAERGLEYEKSLSEPIVATAKEESKTDYQKAYMLFQLIKDNLLN